MRQVRELAPKAATALATLATFFVILPGGAQPAAALPTTSAQRALAVPTAYVTINYSNAQVTYFWTPRTEAGAQAARLFVHSREQ
ncbi:hypothetical protein [Nonomuraea sp. B5E05]|uniref:hypothetical protein n=1 Tax=Nonomuraea sp. B5E05 TaxID=3153569 RepID=UPI003260B6AD